MPPTWPSSFTVQGKCLSGSLNFQRFNQVSDADIRLSDDGTVYEMMFVTNVFTPGSKAGYPAQISYSECPVRGNLLTGWTNTVQPNGYPIMQIAPIVGSPNDEGLDTPKKLFQPNIGMLLTYTQSRPGNRPNGVGHISIIQVATSPKVAGSKCKWCQKTSRKVLEPYAAWNLGFNRSGGGLVPNWAGGVLECSPIWKSSTQEMLMFVQGFTGGIGLSDTHKLGRATDKVSYGLGKFTPEPTSYVFDRRVGTAGVWGNADIGMECQVTLDPDGQTLWCLFVSAEVTTEGSYGIGIARSDDWGLTWTMTGATNPLITVTTAGVPQISAIDRIGSPCLIPSYDYSQWLLFFTFKERGNVGGDNGGIYLATATRIP